MILLTRPYEDSVLTAELLAKDNIATHIEPMLSISEREDALADYEKAIIDAEALIITSANALKLLECCKAEHFALPVYTVGRVTADKAKEIGFSAVHYGGEDVTALCATLKLTFEDVDWPKLVYASGDVISHDIATTLSHSGMKIERVVLYNSEPTQALSEKTLELIRQHSFTGALFFSTRSAAIFIELVKQAGCEKELQHIRAFAISNRVASELAALTFASIKVARRPTQDALLELVR